MASMHWSHKPVRRLVGLALVCFVASGGVAQGQGGDLRPGDLVVVDIFAFGPPPPDPPDPAGGVIGVDPRTGAQTTVSSGGFFVNPVGVAFEADANLIIVDQSNPDGRARVIRVNRETGAQELVLSSGLLVTPIGVAVEADGTLLVADADSGVLRIDPVTGAQSVLTPTSDSLQAPAGIAIRAASRLPAPGRIER